MMSSHTRCQGIHISWQPVSQAICFVAEFLGAFAKLRRTTISCVISVRLCVSLYVRPSVRPSARPSVLPSVRPSVRPSVCPSVRPSVLPSVRPSVRQSFHPSVRPSVRPSVLPSVRPSVRPSDWNNSAPTTRIFIKFYIWVFFEKCVKKIQISLKYDKNDGNVSRKPT
jgi:hypothetical protein